MKTIYLLFMLTIFPVFYGMAQGSFPVRITPNPAFPNDIGPVPVSPIIRPIPMYYYRDMDSDGWGNPKDKVSYFPSRFSPNPPSGYILRKGDCDDLNANINPDTVWYKDEDGDTFGDKNNTKKQCTKPLGYVANDGDLCVGVTGTTNGCSISQYEPVVLSDKNYTYTRVYQTEMNDSTEISLNKDVIESVTYFDGLGRPEQEIGIKASSNGKDIVTHIAYDQYGRETKKHLPFERETMTAKPLGSYAPVDVISDINSYYKNKYPDDFSRVVVADVNAYSESIFENNPMDRVLKQAAPGADWKTSNTGDDHTIKFGHKSNVDQDKIIHYEISFEGNTTKKPILVEKGFYEQRTLYCTVTKDENWEISADHNIHTTREYKDKSGRVILKRNYLAASIGSIPTLDTYYVYDDYGNLSYVIPPKVNTSDDVSKEELAQLCYQYRYDYRNRLIEKKIPGKGDVNSFDAIIYNNLDQPILTQDALLMEESAWLFTKYDALGRVAYTGKINIPNKTRVEIQAEATAYTGDLWVKRGDGASIGGLRMYYNDAGYPKVKTAEVLTVNYYDKYSFLISEAAVFDNPNTVYNTSISDRTQSLSTGSKVKVLGTPNWITSVTYYDQKARPIYVVSRNEYLNTIDIAKSKLDFVGKVLESTTTHTKDNNAPIVTVDVFVYDDMGRVLKQEQQLNNQLQTIAESSYDELGQLVSKTVGGGLQQIDYNYNIRGWLMGINDVANLGDDLFAFGIHYNTTTEDLGATPLYNGNISETIWKTANDTQKRAYGYQYDALNRITTGTSNDGRYNLSGVTYDKNGNIERLQRTGAIVHRPDQNRSEDFGAMDNLTYSYNKGNQLFNVSDRVKIPFGFTKSTTVMGDQYEYDANGNMTMDPNKNITNIAYNHLNLPTKVSVYNGLMSGNISYIYDATGTKLKKIVKEGRSLTETEYAGNYVYKNGILQFFNTPEGYIEPNALGRFDYVYQFKDHLGNIRLSYSDRDNDGKVDIVRNYTDIDGDDDNANEILQEKNYYPFGLTHKGYNTRISGTPHNYGFGGKEEQDDIGLAWLDFHARNYNPALGRWMNIDPLADNLMQIDLTPYNYSWNNPTNLSDPDGKCPSCLWGALIGAAVEYGSQVATNYIEGKTGSDIWTSIDGGKLLIATGAGALTGGLSAIKVAGAVSKVYKGVAMTGTVVAGNIVEQQIDGKKTVDAGELALEIISDRLPIPKIKAPKLKEVTESVIREAEGKVKRAKNIAGNNPRPSRAEALKKTKENVTKQKAQQKAVNTANKVGKELPKVVDSSAKEFVKETVKTNTIDQKK